MLIRYQLSQMSITKGSHANKLRNGPENKSVFSYRQSHFPVIKASDVFVSHRFRTRRICGKRRRLIYCVDVNGKNTTLNNNSAEQFHGLLTGILGVGGKRTG